MMTNSVSKGVPNAVRGTKNSPIYDHNKCGAMNSTTYPTKFVRPVQTSVGWWGQKEFSYFRAME